MSTADGGVYLGASSQYPGSIQSVDVDMSGTGNLVVATSNGQLPKALSYSSLCIPWGADGSRILKQAGVPAHADCYRLTPACCKECAVSCQNVLCRIHQHQRALTGFWRCHLQPGLLQCEGDPQEGLLTMAIQNNSGSERFMQRA